MGKVTTDREQRAKAAAKHTQCLHAAFSVKGVFVMSRKLWFDSNAILGLTASKPAEARYLHCWAVNNAGVPWILPSREV